MKTLEKVEDICQNEIDRGQGCPTCGHSIHCIFCHTNNNGFMVEAKRARLLRDARAAASATAPVVST